MSTRTVLNCDRCKQDVGVFYSFVDTTRESAFADQSVCREAELCERCTKDLLKWLSGLLCTGCDAPLAKCAAARLAGKVKCCPDCSHHFEPGILPPEVLKPAVEEKPAPKSKPAKTRPAAAPKPEPKTRPAAPKPSRTYKGGANKDEREHFLRTLEAATRANPPGTLLVVSELRKNTPTLSKEDFDRIALELSREEAIILHHHDFPGSLSEAERNAMIKDSHGTYYVGIAKRRSQ